MKSMLLVLAAILSGLASVAHASGVEVVGGQVLDARVQVAGQEGHFKFEGYEGGAAFLFDLDGKAAIKPKLGFQLLGLSLRNQGEGMESEKIKGGIIGVWGRLIPPWVLAPYLQAGLEYAAVNLRRSEEANHLYLGGGGVHAGGGLALQAGKLRVTVAAQVSYTYLGMGMQLAGERAKLRDLSLTRSTACVGLGLVF